MLCFFGNQYQRNFANLREDHLYKLVVYSDKFLQKLRKR